MTKAKVKTKVKPLRFKRCKKHNTLVDISSAPEQINSFTIRSWVAKQCNSCGYTTDKIYSFINVVEEASK